MTKLLIALATTVALAGPAAGGSPTIPRVYRGEWCWPIDHGPFYSPCGSKEEDGEKWLKVTAHNVQGELTIRDVNDIDGGMDTIAGVCRVIAVKPDDGSSHLVTLSCNGTRTVTVTSRFEFVPRSGDGRKSQRLYIDKVSQ